MFDALKNLKKFLSMKPIVVPVSGWGLARVVNLPPLKRSPKEALKKPKSHTIKPPFDRSELRIIVASFQDDTLKSQWTHAGGEISLNVGAKSSGRIGIGVWIEFHRQTGGEYVTKWNPKGDWNPFTKEGRYHSVFVPSFHDYQFRFGQTWEIERQDGRIMVTRPNFVGPEGEAYSWGLMRLGAKDPQIHTWMDYGGKSNRPYVKISFGLVGPDDAYSKKNRNVRIGSFLLNLQAAVITPIPVPKDLQHVVQFGVDKPHADKDELHDIERWMDALKRDSKDLYVAIDAGKCPIRLEGHASATGSRKHNRDLAAGRIESVREAIKDRLKQRGRARFLPTNLGKENTTQKGEVPRERRVVVTIKETDAATAISDALRARE